MALQVLPQQIVGVGADGYIETVKTLLPLADDTYYLGSATLGFKGLHVATDFLLKEADGRLSVRNSADTAFKELQALKLIARGNAIALPDGSNYLGFRRYGAGEIAMQLWDSSWGYSNYANVRVATLTANSITAGATTLSGALAMGNNGVSNVATFAGNNVADGLHAQGVARACYDFALDGGAISTIGLHATIPDNAIVVRAWYEVLTTLTSSGDNATVSLDIPTDDVAGILAAIAIDDGSNPWDAGTFACIQDGTVGNFSNKCTAAREISMTIAVEALTAGKFILWCQYIVSD